jgi:predicted enzyme related to lactoylglutathione lyase
MKLKEAPITPTIPAADMERAKRFYREKLDLEPAQDSPEGSYYELADGTGFLLYPSENAGKAPTTYAGWNVDDVEAMVRELKAKGVQFENYDYPDLKTEEGIATMPDGSQAAWFKDSEGNILAIAHMP